MLVGPVDAAEDLVAYFQGGGCARGDGFDGAGVVEARGCGLGVEEVAGYGGEGDFVVCGVEGGGVAGGLSVCCGDGMGAEMEFGKEGMKMGFGRRDDGE